MNYKDYITPVVCGILGVICVCFFSSKISSFLSTSNTLGSDMFNFFALLFGLALTCYSMIFGLIPSLRKDFKNSQTVKDVIVYFKISLFFLLISVVSSFVYLIWQNELLFLINLIMMSINIGFLGYMILLINEIFFEAKN